MAAKKEPEFKFSVRKLKEFEERVKDRVGQWHKGTAMAMMSVGEEWMTEAKKRTPVDTGALRASGHVQGPEEIGDTMIVKLVFGGPSADYAMDVHENLDAYHRVGQAKYLESVILERKGTYVAEVKRYLVSRK